MKSHAAPAALAAAVLAVLVTLPSAAPGQSCDPFDPCTIGGMCQPTGECLGTPAPNGTTCNDFNDCTVNDQCQQGQCAGTADLSRHGQPCVTAAGLCATATCEIVEIPMFPQFNQAFCLPESFVTCDDPGEDQCTISLCNPATGQCEMLTNSCFGECGSCDPETGDCTVDPKPDGAACDDFNPCTANDGCQSGECVSGGPQCFADCDGDGDVDTADLQKISSVIVQCGPCDGGVAGGVAAGCPAAPGGCPAADFNGDGCLRASDLTRALQNVLSHSPDGCPP